MEYQKRYQSLNNAQKEAVDTIDGPVMVVAGPGTGKTELLSVRVANILRKTDTLPSSVLCLTFTDSASSNMRERLVGLIGAEAYNVAIHTFHSFGSEVMNRYSQYFYHGAHFKPADELSTYEILNELLQKLPHDNPIASTMNGEFTHISDLRRVISDMKRSGLTPDELFKILDHNEAFCDWIKPHLQPAFGPTISKKQLPAIRALLDSLEDYKDEPLALIGYVPLVSHIRSTLTTAVEDAEAQNSTKPLSAWKKLMLYKDERAEQSLKDAKHSKKLRHATQLYYDYLVAMQEQELYDYDDMILRVVHAMEVFDELRYELQEQYQYILVDEFQDTNEAQMRMLWNLTNNPSQEGRPNILVVGDDDQAIYRFQGADMSNVLDFTQRYRDVRVITLTDNYRSGAPILDMSRHVVKQIDERLETQLEGVEKTLIPHHKSRHAIDFVRYHTQSEMRHQLSKQILTDYRKNPSKTRAVIARKHHQLLSLVPHLEAIGVPLRYEYQENVLDSEPALQLELVGRIVLAIAGAEYEEANTMMPELLAHPAWQVPARDVWSLGINAQRNGVYWLEEMLASDGRLQDIAEWLIITAQRSLAEPLESIIDTLFGVVESQASDSHHSDEFYSESSPTEDFSSPLRAYFFPSEGLETSPTQYIVWLHALQRLRSQLRDYRSTPVLRLSDFISYISMHREAGIAITASTDIEHDDSAVTLLSAHKSKGLEFDHVYILDASEHVWGTTARSKSQLITFPSNMPLSPAGASQDERLRLLFVALTRARDNLTLITATERDNGKAILPIGAVIDHTSPIDSPSDSHEAITALTNDWRKHVLDVPIATKDQLLRPLLARYKLSATHLNNYLNVASGGPELFLLHNLLRFPQAMGPSAVYGSAIHTTLQRAHAHLSATSKRRPIEDVLHDFELIISEASLSVNDQQKFLDRGVKALTKFLESRYDTFAPSQIVERSFGGEQIMVGDARVTGAIDLIDIDDEEKTIFITDYKTGKPSASWKGSSVYEKIKLHHYQQQLMMYYLLVSRSGQFNGYTITGARLAFVEPDSRGDTVSLDYDYDIDELARFEELVQSVWQHIMAGKFEVEVSYDETITGITAFENDLLQK